MAHFLRKLEDEVEDLEEKVEDLFHKNKHREQNQEEGPAGAPPSTEDNRPAPRPHVDTIHRFGSFAPQTTGHAKWYVDGASYFWAVSIALQGR